MNRPSNVHALRVTERLLLMMLMIWAVSWMRQYDSDSHDIEEMEGIMEHIADSVVEDASMIIGETEQTVDPVVENTETNLCPDESLEPPLPHQLPLFCAMFLCPTDEKCDECISPKLFPKEPSKKRMRLRIWGKERTSQSALDDIYIIRHSEEISRESRRMVLKDLVAVEMGLDPKDGPITLFTLNGGYSYLFLNWLCSLHHNDIAQDIRKSTIIIATDDVAKATAEKVGFHVIRSEWLQKTVDKKASSHFGAGAHKWANAVHMVYVSDLIHLGYDTLSSDVDTVWIRDVRTYFDAEKDQYDVAMPYDGRDDDSGPGNAGTFPFSLFIARIS